MESNALICGETTNATIDSIDREIVENSETISPIKNAISNYYSDSSKLREDEISDCADSNRKTIIDENTESNSDKNRPVSDNFCNGVKKKYKTFLDSDSEEEEKSSLAILEKNHSGNKLEGYSLANDNDGSEKSHYFPAQNENAKKFTDEDSGDEESLIGTNFNENDQKETQSLHSTGTAETLKRKFRAIIDSDSAEEDPPRIMSDNENLSEGTNQTKTKLKSILDSESEYENDSHSTSPTVKTKKKTKCRKIGKAETSMKKSKFSNLVDTDSEEDTERLNANGSFNEESENVALAKKGEKKGKKRTGSVRAAKDEAMRQIHSETQRLVRNSAISLPYHVPKQRTLQDFLNRKKLIPSLPEGLSTALKVKMSSEIVSKALEEKEKEAETFYKSSDSEEEEITCTPLNSNALDDTICPVVVQTSIEETQKILKNDLQNAHNKKEVIHQGGAEIGVPRKLFIDEPLEREASIEAEEEEATVTLDPRKRTKEAKAGMREGNAPRKLFPSNYDEGVDSPPKNSTIVSEDAKRSEKRGTIEADGENVDEGIHSLEKNNESSDDCGGNDLVVPKLSDSELAETPFISNREYAKLNEREKLTKARADCKENSQLTDDPETPVFGDVIGLPPPTFDESFSAGTRKKYLTTLSKIEPKLRGSPGMMIDLTEDSKPDKDGVQSLRDRFFRHSIINKAQQVEQAAVSVMRTEKTADGLKVVEEILPYKIPAGGFTKQELEKPGAKYKRLRMDLIEKMAKKRGDEWELEAQRERENREEEEEEIMELDEEEGMTESEPEEDDMPAAKEEKKRKRREFADDEAEVSFDEIDEEEEEEEDEDDICLRVEKERDTGGEEEEEEEDDRSNTEEWKKSGKSRIVKAFEDDSNSESDPMSETEAAGGKVLERTKTDVDMFGAEDEDWSSENETEFPPSQILPRDRADCKTPSTAINALRFVSPITQLTALNTSCNTPKESPADISLGSCRVSGSFADKTPNGFKESPISCDNDKRLNFQKKLFEDTAVAINDDELMGLCSGKFTGIENEAKDPIDPIDPMGRVTETQLLGLCSGAFTSQIFSSEEDNRVKNMDENSQNIRLAMEGDSNDSCCGNARLRVKSSESEDENSDDENGPRNVNKKRKVLKLNLSDEEESTSEEEEDYRDEEVEENDEKYVDYDSEENEIVVVPKKDIKKVAATFVEAEAELSESEWGSEDEDEKDLDKLEFEEADGEEIDENQMRDELGKIHMRRVQDDDRREVRMLQELLFDDGDLHTDGSGRERKFKWKNIDKLDNDEKLGSRDENGGENGDIVDDETDLAWLSEKIEREKFLEDKTKTNTDEVIIEDLARDSQVFSLGMKALKRTKSNQSCQKEQLEPVITKPMASRTILDLVDTQSLGSSRTIIRKAVSRGSFLARGDECLARMAVHLKETDTTVLQRANPRNFVFGQINLSDEEPTKMNENDLTEELSSEASKGNKRKSTGGLTPRSTKKRKLERARPTGKKLY